jgi:hypothetical protein
MAALAETIGAEIVNEISVFCYLISIDAEMFGNDALNSIAKHYSSFSNFFSPGSFSRGPIGRGSTACTH